MTDHPGLRVQRRVSVVVPILSLLFCAGCSTSTTAPTASTGADTNAALNTVCPVMGGEATSEITVEWKGRKVAFCCPPCIEEWNELSDDEKETRLKTASVKPHGESPSSGTH